MSGGHAHADVMVEAGLAVPARLPVLLTSLIGAGDRVLDPTDRAGLHPLVIIFRHIVPNTFHILLVQATIVFVAAIKSEVILSFLGLGVQPPTPSWGQLIKDGSERMREAPWMLIYPGVMFALTLFSFNFVGDGLRDALDPKTSKD